MKLKAFLIAYAVEAATALGVLLAATTFSLFDKKTKGGGSYGEIGLRSYFEKGTGETPEDAYVITRPRHLYNLSRLQRLGIFNKKVYFKLGLAGIEKVEQGQQRKYDINQPLCYKGETDEVLPYLDMDYSQYSNYTTNTINAIGSESVPFYGEFDGQNVEISGLHVYADPQDAGLFGYTAHQSKVENLFLSNITIHTMGYNTATYSHLYGSDILGNGATGMNPYFTYVHGQQSVVFGSSGSTPDAYTFQVDWGTEGSSDPNVATISGASPTISAVYTPYGKYGFDLLRSGSFLNKPTNNQFTINLEDVKTFFFDKRREAGIEFPIRASSSMSAITSLIDDRGLTHSRVLFPLNFEFSLASGSATEISLTIKVGNDHSNNIGLIIGHCDGSVDNCYVYNGKFDMNNGGDFNASTSTKVSNESTFGLIGLVGNTVHNLSAEEGNAIHKRGTSTGYLDFSAIYDEVIDANSFPNPAVSFTNGEETGYVYTPKQSENYTKLLRTQPYREDSSQPYTTRYVTSAENAISFKGLQVIRNSETGVFTIVTDQTSDGINSNVLVGIRNSVITKGSKDLKYLFYTTGEYRKILDPESQNPTTLSFSDYRQSFDSVTPSKMTLGYHLPRTGQATPESFFLRELRQNYFFRLKLDSRSAGRNYFADVDKTSPGGAFINNYFHYKLVDQSSEQIPATSPLCGLTLRRPNHDPETMEQYPVVEIDKFNSSFGTKDHSDGSYMYCVSNAAEGNPAANKINFAIKTKYANVTIVAGLTDPTKSAAVGIYRTGSTTGSGVDLRLTQSYSDPDYAFFMPKRDHLAYFDYVVEKVNNNDVGKIGTMYVDTQDNNKIKFREADNTTPATVPYTVSTPGYQLDNETPQLFAHTFKLPEGHYCIGSATGEHNKNDNNYALGTAKIYYVGAQGQTEGVEDTGDTTYGGNDTVENVDFLKTSRFNASTKAVNIAIPGVDYNTPEVAYSVNNIPANGLEYLRCYVELMENETGQRSKFAAETTWVDFACVYDNQTSKYKFNVTTDALANMTRLFLTNYGSDYGMKHSISLSNMLVKLFNQDYSTASEFKHPTSS